MAKFRIVKGGLQDRFFKSRAKVQIFAGGFANGKTSAACIKALELARDYPGSNGLIARSTYPKLNDTIRKEFLKWCPKDWIVSFPMSANASNTCTMANGTTVNFRYIAQQGKQSKDATTSNLLSATYDWIIVDQMEDPEIVHKDFLDLLGRLRGSAAYIGDDPTMPESGPRYMIITTNPTRNWLYRHLVRPLHDFKRGLFNPRLLCEKTREGKLVLDEDNLPIPLIELFEGSTYENEDNLEEDYLQGLEASYEGQMRKRFLLGEWAAYEGLVYPAFDEAVHVLSHNVIENYLSRLAMEAEVEYLEGYDFGIAVPSCYIVGFVDLFGNVFLIDGFYKAEYDIDDQLPAIVLLRAKYNVPDDNQIYADPDIFKRKQKTVGGSTASKFLEAPYNLFCVKGNNDILNGIVKVGQYLNVQKNHKNPITGEFGSPFLYISDKLEWIVNEFTDYYWKKDPTGEVQDKPIDKDDHAMDTIKYLLSKRPDISVLIRPEKNPLVGLRRWTEMDDPIPLKRLRHG